MAGALMKLAPAVLLLFSICGAALAQPDAETLEARLPQATGPERLELLVDLAARYREDDPARAVELGNEALALLRSDPDRRRELEALNSLAYANVLLGDYQPALQLGARAEELARATGDASARAFAFRTIGRGYRSLSDYEHALDAYRRAAELSTEAGDRPELGDALNDIGVVHWYRGDYPQALKYFIQARETYEEAGDRQRVAKILNNTGMIYRKLAQPAKALELYRQALEVRREVGPAGALSNVLSNIGNIYLDMGEPARALEHYLESLGAGPKDTLGRASTIVNVGIAYEDLGDLDRALEHYTRAIGIEEEIGDRLGVGSTLVRIGGIRRQRGELASALETLQQSVAILEEVEAKDETKDAYLELSQTYADMGRYREALEAFRRYEQVKSEIFNEQNSQIIAEMEARFESDRKEKEIEILRQRQALDALETKRQAVVRRALSGGLALLLLGTVLFYNRRHRLKEARERQRERERYVTRLEAGKAEVEARNAEMERFTYTVSHDLKSPLITIRGFLGLVERDAKAGDMERMEKDIARISAATERMARLLDELLQLSRIGRVMSEPKDVSMTGLAREAMEQLASQIADSGARMEVAADLPMAYGDRARLLEVLQNLIENAVKFIGDETSPRVEVGWRQDGGESVFFVSDNGIGIEPKYHEKVFALFDRLDPSIDGTGIGLALVKRIIEVHGGRIWVESAGLGHGSTFCFTLPAKKDAEDREADFTDDGAREVAK